MAWGGVRKYQKIRGYGLKISQRRQWLGSVIKQSELIRLTHNNVSFPECGSLSDELLVKCRRFFARRKINASQEGIRIKKPTPDKRASV